ncbi:hypothetical protein WN944_025333 [Citrus x changshan-huyou]|uniref:Pre-mRNA polyadenylation factor Fip1 domain-containing protein n=1 Tax=Citrus x changshan-huyou TaxID=2935761 RepID=A0AAP0LVW6_9ROSI
MMSCYISFRTILDINTDSFEEKPWSQPGGNKSDFFNFDFTQNSRKRYCSLLMAGLLHITPTNVCEVKHGNRVREFKSEDITHFIPLPKFPDRGDRLFDLPKGRAIEVESNTGECRPSIDVRHLRIQDSDVVIQVKVQYTLEDCSGSGKERLMSIDSDDHGNGKVSDRDWHHHQKLNVCTSEKKTEAAETFKKADKKVGCRHTSPKRKVQKHHSGRCCGVMEERICPKSSDDDASPISNDAEGIYYRDYKSVDCGRQKERLHVLGYLEREDFSYYRGTGSSSGYSSERNYQSSNFRSYGECYAAKQGRWLDTRSSIGEDHAVFDTGLLERHWSHIYGQDYGWDEIYYDTDDTNDSYYNNNPVDFGGRHGWQSQKLLRIADGKFIARDLANELFAQKASISYLETSMLERIRAKQESDSHGMLIGDRQFKCPTYKLTGEGSIAKCVSRNYNTNYRCKHDHPVLMCRDSLHLIVEERKAGSEIKTLFRFNCMYNHSIANLLYCC